MKVLVFLTLIFAVCSAAAQEEEPGQAEVLPDPASLPPLPEKEDKGEAIGDPQIQFVIDEAFTEKHEHDRTPSEPFSVVAPNGENVYVIAGGRKSGAKEFLRVSVADKDKKPVEVVRFSDLTVPMLEKTEDRLKICCFLLGEHVMPSIQRGYEDGEIRDVYRTKVNGLDAVVLHSHMVDPKSKNAYAVKIVGILKPEAPGAVMMFTMANTKGSEIREISDLESKGYGQRILHTLKFVD
ncbi:MAG: hypothetical protein AAF585_03190 [Verrucomicrobiota bacterium]